MPNEELAGQVNANGCWTSFNNVRTTGARGSVEFDPVEKAGVSFCMRLRDRNGNRFTDDICWAENENGRKTIATNVLAGTRFTIDARGTNGKTGFTGTIFFG